MPEHKLTVRPARRVYAPAYPSYADKNPLLHPDTRPYPFTLKFINWAGAGGLAGLMLLGNGGLGAQNAATVPAASRNPFPLSRASVPYQPVSFGTGLPTRLNSEAAVAAIRRAFAASGVVLQEEVLLEEEGVSIYLDGYSPTDSIGFVFMNHGNMDDSFRKQGANGGSVNKSSIAESLTLITALTAWQRTRGYAFNAFIRDKPACLNRYNHRQASAGDKAFATVLAELPATEAAAPAFNEAYLQWSLDKYRKDNQRQESMVDELIAHLDQRFPDTPDKAVLFQYARTAVRGNNRLSAAATERGATELERIKLLTSDEAFVTDFLTLRAFQLYFSDIHRLGQDPGYGTLKLRVMENYPLSQWFDHTDELDDYRGRQYLSMTEAQNIDEANANGERFVAPISLFDSRMIVPNTGYGWTAEAKKAEEDLRKEFNRKNGTTKKVRDQKDTELRALNDKYGYTARQKMTGQAGEEAKVTYLEQQTAVDAKYKAMERLTEAEKEAYKLRFKALKQEARANRKILAAKHHTEVIRRLETEVRSYIEWVRSQQGG